MRLNECMALFLSNIVRAVVEAHAAHAVAKHASAWGIGTEVCMRMGHQRPIMHVQGAPAPNCACAVEHSSHPQTRKHMEPQQPKPSTLNP